jgi:signal transduction histidine kinase
MSAISAKIYGTGAACLLLAAAYYIGVNVGFTFTLEPNAVSLVWPPNALVLAAFLLSRRRDWPWLALAVLPPHLYVQLSSGVPLPMALCWYVSNLSEAFIGAWLICTSLQRVPQFDTVRDASAFLIGGVFVAPVVSSFIDAGFVASVGWRYAGDYWAVWRMRLFSNALATITLVPLIIIVSQMNVRSLIVSLRERGVEAAVLLTLLSLTSWFVFHREYEIGAGATYVYAPLPFIVWAAVRLGVGGVGLCVTVVALLSITGEMHGVGPFSRASPEDAVLSLQIFLLIATSTLMLLAASLCELQQARATALRGKESLDLALSAAHMGVWEWDVTADRFTWQRASQDERMTLSTHQLLDIVHPDDRGALINTMRQARSGEDVGQIECRVTRRDSIRWVLGKGKHLRKERHAPVRLIGVWMDITQSKHREAQERSQRDQLAHLSRVAMLGELSGALTHELSQPLSAMLFNSYAALKELDKNSPDLQEIRAMIEDIAADDTRAAEVIRRLRALFKRGTVQKERVDVADCVQAALALEHSDLIVRGVTTSIEIGRDMPRVDADPIQIQQVLLNLIVNACEAMNSVPTHERRLHIVVNNRSDAGLVHIAVSDNGSGIPDPERIFEPFFTTKTHGIGLGLAISRSIVGAHGGKLWATNNPGRGATLHVELTAASDASDPVYQVSAARARS